MWQPIVCSTHTRALNKRILKETRQCKSYAVKVAEFINDFAEWVRDGGFTAKCVEVIIRGGLLVIESQQQQLDESVENLSSCAGGHPSERAGSHWSDEFQDEVPTMTLEAMLEGPGATLLEFPGAKLASAKQKTQKALDKVTGTVEKLKAHSATAFTSDALSALGDKAKQLIELAEVTRFEAVSLFILKDTQGKSSATKKKKLDKHYDTYNAVKFRDSQHGHKERCAAAIWDSVFAICHTED